MEGETGELIQKVQDKVRSETVHKSDYFIVNFFGATASGADLTRTRQLLEDTYGKDGYFSPSSGLFGKEGYRAKENGHMRNLRFANEIVKKSDGRPIIIHGSSSGTQEVIEVLNELVTRPEMKGRVIRLVISCSPGVENKRIRGLIEFGNGFLSQFKTMHTLEQHITYPGPERLYTNNGIDKNIGMKIFHDMPEDRARRRDVFEDHVIRLIPNETERTQFLLRLKKIDEELIQAQESGNEKLLQAKWEERGEILRPYKEMYFHGGLVDDETTSQYVRDYQELQKGLLSRVWMILQSVGLLDRMVNSIWKGYQERFVVMHDKAKKNNIAIDYQLVYMQNDPLMPYKKYQMARDRFSKLGLPIAWDGVFEQLAHQSIGQYPEALLQILKHITKG